MIYSGRPTICPLDGIARPRASSTVFIMTPSIDVLPPTPGGLVTTEAIPCRVAESRTCETTRAALKVRAREDIKTVDGLVRYRARVSPDATLLAYPSSGINYVNYTASQLDAFAYRVGKHYQQLIPSRNSSKEKPRVIGLLGPSNLEYIVTILALIKLGHTVLFLSTRISLEAILFLMKETGAGHLVADGSFSEIAGKLRNSALCVEAVDIASRDIFEFPVEAAEGTRLDHALDPDVEASYDCWIIHSSGTHGSLGHVFLFAFVLTSTAQAPRDCPNPFTRDKAPPWPIGSTVWT